VSKRRDDGGDIAVSNDPCACCGRTIKGEPLTLRGRVVCGAQCFAVISRQERPAPEMLGGESRRGVKVFKSGYWMRGKRGVERDRCDDA